MLRKYKIFMGLFGLLFFCSVAGLTITLVKLDPYKTTALALGAFYLCGFAMTLSAGSLIGFALRRWFGTREMVAAHFKQSLRQGFWFGLMAMALLVLQSFRLASLINTLLLVFALIFLEFYFISKEKQTFNN